MSLHPQPINEIPEQTIAVAQAAFPKGNVYMTMRDELGVFYTDEAFAKLFSNRGQPAESPWRLALITIMQFAENLTDRQAANAVRSRIDWKYALGLELTDPGFHFSVLSDFRARLVNHEASEQLLNEMLTRFKARDLIKVRGKQRTDSTHIVAAVRELNRLEQVGETLRYTLNILAELVPTWLKTQVPVEWFDRYSDRFENHRLPTKKQEREVLVKTIGADGYHLLAAVYATKASSGLWELAVVQHLRIVWLQQFYLENNAVHWRDKHNVPPGEKMIVSPYDPEVRYSRKRSTEWIGYKTHLTETCDADAPCLITHVETTSSTVQDVEVVDDVHNDLAEHDNLPGEHLVDMGYMSSDVLVTSQQLEVDLIGPVRPDTSWQAQTEGAFDLTQFEIDWDRKAVKCPQKAQYLALKAARERQQTDEFKDQYQARAGVEGVISQATVALNMRRTRYRGQDKTHLQNVATASAVNLLRAVNWLLGKPKAKTRVSSFAALAA